MHGLKHAGIGKLATGPRCASLAFCSAVGASLITIGLQLADALMRCCDVDITPLRRNNKNQSKPKPAMITILPK